MEQQPVLRKQKADCATNLFKEVKEKWQKEQQQFTTKGL
jgi:hypothetical protein